MVDAIRSRAETRSVKAALSFGASTSARLHRRSAAARRVRRRRTGHTLLLILMFVLAAVLPTAGADGGEILDQRLIHRDCCFSHFTVKFTRNMLI